MFTPRDGDTVSIGTLEDIRKAYFGPNTPRMGLSVQTLEGGQVVACQPQYNREYVKSVGRCSVYKNGSDPYNFIPTSARGHSQGNSVGGFSTTTIPGAESVFFVSAPNERRGVGYIAAVSSTDGKTIG